MQQQMTREQAYQILNQLIDSVQAKRQDFVVFTTALNTLNAAVLVDQSPLKSVQEQKGK